jgi:RHH-type proline utilization regulon transcriptional repressor/proline dehydrogenase/delta 1-pyrroline-5-carboxylate dehydrogenase
MAGQPVLKEESVWRDILSPANQGRKIGQIREADVAEVEFALTAAGASTWSQLPVLVKAEKLEAAAVALAKSDQLFQLIIHEAGKTLSNAVGEVREAVDFLNYYAAQLRKAEVLMAHAQPLGVSLVISPWNFPLAIPIGQVSAALAAGNTVILKPAEQSSMVALYATKLLHDAGIPKDALQCLPGRGESVGVALTSSGCFQSVLFTGSNETARRIESSLKKAHQQKGVEEPVFVAETGGINAMIVDSSALGEQVVSDVLQSAFDSAGQRCSALRLLCLQEDQAAHIMVLLKNAMLELTMGVPEFLQTDVGPVIDQEARDKIRNYIETCRARGLSVFQTAMPDSTAEGFFIAPTLIEVSSISEVNQEVFGPVLHVVRFSRDSLHQVLADIRRLGFGLTMGLHTRVDERIADVLSHSAVGNFYVNRNMIGAVVGVQPFGGEGLSGTGPKAGGPLMIPRLCRGLGLDWLEKMGVNEATFEQVRKLSLRSLVYVESLAEEAQGVRDRFDLFAKHISVQSKSAEKMSRLLYVPTVLTSITGEHNAWWMTKRGKVAVYAQDTDSLLRVSLFVLASGNQPVWVTEQKTKGTIESVYRQLPADLNRWVQLLPIDQIDRLSPEQRIDVVVCMDNLSLSFSGHGEIVRKINVSVENLDLVAYQESLMMSLLHERAISINTAAAGGNTSLMTMG